MTLVLNVPVVRGADIFGSRYDTIMHLARTDWPAYVELSTSTYGRGSWITGNAFSSASICASESRRGTEACVASEGFGMVSGGGDISAERAIEENNA